jgi:hypothetical protein
MTDELKKEIAKIRNKLFSGWEIMCKYRLSFEDLKTVFQYSKFPQKYRVKLEKMFSYPMETGMYLRNEVEAFFEDENQKKRIEIERVFYKKCINYRSRFYYKIDYTTEHLTCEFNLLSEKEINNLFFDISKMTWLKHLSITNLQGTLPESIGNLTKLRELSLSHSQLEYLPDGIGNLKELNHLDLNSNKFESLPDCICNLTELVELNLMDNKLKSLPESLGNLTKLERLSLWNNELTSLPESIYNLTNLKSLSVGDNKLESLPKNINKCVIIR